MSKHKKPIKSRKPVQPETPTKQQDTDPKQSPNDVMREAGFDVPTDSDFEPTWDDIEKYIALMRIKYNNNGD